MSNIFDIAGQVMLKWKFESEYENLRNCKACIASFVVVSSLNDIGIKEFSYE